MPASDRAGQPATDADLVDVDALRDAYYDQVPDPSVPAERVSFGTSGHRGSALDRTFNEAHILATTQAICEYRAEAGTDGPLFLGMDTHALSEPAHRSALEVLAAHDVAVRLAPDDAPTPTPAVSHAILTHNDGRTEGLADGIVITPSHNPPADGGFKYNPTTGGPAGTEATAWIERRANEILENRLRGVRRRPVEKARRAETTETYDFLGRYVEDLDAVVDLAAIRDSDLALAVDPLGGAGVRYWSAIAEHYDLPLEVLRTEVDPTFRFMTLDWDGQIRMDPSSAPAMQSLIDLKDEYDVAFACDTDHDRHGIVTGAGGLMAPNHFLCVMLDHLLTHRPDWPAGAGLGKTVVSTSLLTRIAEAHGRATHEVPVGFKWFVDGLLDGSCGFVGEESAGASFLRRDGSVWTTDKDGIIAGLLAAEVAAVQGQDPSARYDALTAEHGAPVFKRIDAPATPAQKQVLKDLTPDQVTSDTLAGDPVTAVRTRAPGNDAPIGGLKVETENGWFVARPSGTESIYKIYAESFRGADHLDALLDGAQALVTQAFEAAPDVEA
jgi:phosphoglucomutase